MVSRRHLIIAGVIVFSVSYVVAGGLGQPTENPSERKNMSEAERIQPVENGSYLWPYTSRRQAPSGRTLAINLIIHGSDERVKTVLTEQTRLNWRVTEPQNETDANATANGSTNSTASNESAATATAPTPNTDATTDTPAATPTTDSTQSTPTANGTATATPTANGTATATPTANNTTATPQSRWRSIRLGESGLRWNDAHGSTRYTYIDTGPVGGNGRWLDEAYQIHTGAYFGSRYHIRAYTAGRTNWTAIQIHREYWDWFRLRHTVTDIRRSRNVLESQFLNKPYVTDVRREYYGVNRGWNDGWLSEIELAPALIGVLLFGLVSTKTRRELQRDGRLAAGWLRQNVRGIVLAAAIASQYLGVRSAGIVLESTVPELDPRVFLAVLYPAIAVGLPILAFVFAQPYGATTRFSRLQRVARWLGPQIKPLPAFGFAALGLGAGFVLDFGGIGVKSIPVQLALHRIGLAVALGLVAAGAARIDERGGALLMVGVLGWIVGLAMPLLGYL